MDLREAIIADRSSGIAVGEWSICNHPKPVPGARASAEHMLPLIRPMRARFSPDSAIAGTEACSAYPRSDVGPQVRTYAWSCRAAQGSCRTSRKTCRSDRVRGFCRTSSISVRADPDLRVIESIPCKGDRSCISSSVGTRGEWMSWTPGPISFGYLKPRKVLAARPVRADRDALDASIVETVLPTVATEPETQ